MFPFLSTRSRALSIPERRAATVYSRPSGRSSSVNSSCSPALSCTSPSPTLWTRFTTPRSSDVTKIPQLWALYKEVQGYYEKGMRVPDDVTLLWCDDNWGNIRRLPTPEERKRAGGARIYYHFDYVGGPRNYKWIDTNPIPKIWEQMNLALQYDAKQIWIVNVGDLKPMEFPTEFFLSLARNPARWPKEKLAEFTELWAAREIGQAHVAEIAELV